VDRGWLALGDVIEQVKDSMVLAEVKTVVDQVNVGACGLGEYAVENKQ
jgi:hypothetical protein